MPLTVRARCVRATVKRSVDCQAESNFLRSYKYFGIKKPHEFCPLLGSVLFFFFQEFKQEERTKMEIYALAVSEISQGTADSDDNITLNLEVMMKNTSNPRISVTKDGIMDAQNMDEYKIKDYKLVPRSPASGDSGKAIFNLFTSHVMPMLISLGLKLNESDEYNFCIVNPVPYQTSLVSIHQKGLITSVRDKVWKVMYPELKEIFKSKLDSYKPFIILNGCTSNLKDLLQPEINQIQNCKVFNVNHPASWQRSLSGFKIP